MGNFEIKDSTIFRNCLLDVLE